MANDRTPYTLTQAEGELIELVNGAAEPSFVFSIGCDADGMWTLRFCDMANGKERQVSGATFEAAWMALRHGPRGFAPVRGGRQ